MFGGPCLFLEYRDACRATDRSSPVEMTMTERYMMVVLVRIFVGKRNELTLGPPIQEYPWVYTQLNHEYDRSTS